VILLALKSQGIGFSTHVALLVTVAVTTVCWVLTAYLGPQTDRQVLIEFWRKVRPAGPGWAPIRAAAGPVTDTVADRDNIPLALLGWVAGSIAIWSALFAEGSYLYGRTPQAIMLTVVFAVSATVMIGVVRRMWN
jgi:hypothetical protein